MTQPTRFTDDGRGRYALHVDGTEVGYVDYDLVGAVSILIKHAEVHAAHEGKGFGSQLVRAALEHAHTQGKTVIPICPYTLAFLRRHPEYHDVVREDMRRAL